MKLGFTLFVALAAVVLSLSLVGCEKTKFSMTVTEIIDGDTITVKGLKENVRLIGIDCPELIEGSKPVGQYAEQARLFAEEKLLESGAKVSLILQGEDTYGRHLAYVYTRDGKMLNLELLRNGLARPLTYEETSDHSQEFKRAYQEAFKERRGIFSSYDTDKVYSAFEVRSDLRPYSQGGFLGRVVWIEFLVTDASALTMNGKDIIVKVRGEEFRLFVLEGFGFQRFYRKRVKVYGEVWRDWDGKALLLLRDPAIEIRGVSDLAVVPAPSIEYALSGKFDSQSIARSPAW